MSFAMEFFFLLKWRNQNAIKKHSNSLKSVRFTFERNEESKLASENEFHIRLFTVDM